MSLKNSYSYAQMETAFARMYGAETAERVRRLRGRIKNYQVLGIPMERRPGRGSKRPYSLDEVNQLMFCLELAQLTVDPTVAAALVKDCWKDTIGKVFLTADHAFMNADGTSSDNRKDKCLTIVLHSLSHPLKEKAVGNTTGSTFPPLFFEMLRTGGDDRWDGLIMPQRSIVLNATSIVRSFKVCAEEPDAHGDNQEA